LPPYFTGLKRGEEFMKARKKAMLGVLAAMIAVLAAVGFYYWYRSVHFVITEDARVDADKLRVSPQIAGKLIELDVDEGDKVKAGQIIGRQTDVLLPPGADPELAVVKSPISGTIIKKEASVGEIVAPGQAIVIVADLQKSYITANIEETDLNKVRPGQKVEFTIDAIPGHVFTGKVYSIGEATLSTFSLFASANAGGTFTKVTQRIPVKIIFDNYQGQHVLPGMNAVVKIHVK